MNIDKNKISPMMKQYMDIKNRYENHILFFRLGDFYEMFFDDAITASKVLELTLTGRDCGLSERAPMCGVPYHSSEIYIKKLIESGYKVAICEQMTDPAESKGIVEREVIRVVTPGTLIESSMLDDSSNNYICSVYFQNYECALCFADISTGEVNLLIKNRKDIQNDITNELSRFNPAEIIFNQEFLSLSTVTDYIQNHLHSSVTLRDDESFSPDMHSNIVLTQFSAESLEDLGLNKNNTGTFAVCGLFYYISEMQKVIAGRFTSINIQSDSACMGLDLTARRNLELTETIRNKEKKGTLLWVLDYTKTSMGKRLLKSYIEQPLISPAKIMERLDAVDQLCKKSVFIIDIADVLDKVYDLERLMTRVVYKTASPRDIKSLSTTAMQLPMLKELLQKLDNSKLLQKLNDNISTLDSISSIVEKSIIDEPPVSSKDGGIIKDGFNSDLDYLRNIITNGNGIIEEIAQRERDKTGIKNLKIGYNRVFGYYIEVTRSYYDLIPDDYIRKQTLANCERFITDELKKTENDILSAKEKAIQLETDIFAQIRDFIASKLQEVQTTASAVAAVDVLCSFAYVSNKNFYAKPEISMDGVIEIKDGRHPVVELMLGDDVFVPNDTYIDTKSNRMSIITGPNMSGKSTYMRQVALITLMAQIGCFVPAKYARISIVDKIFTRVGASDDLTAGQSTFMVEMSEVADILKHATKNSLVILDEVGRGTSTFDGISIAKAVAEYICNEKSLGCKTLFATHYHELISLENENDGIKNYSVAVKKHGDNIRFLRRIVHGGVDDSYGIDVAKLAGLPKKVINRAKSVLSEMEKNAVRFNAEKLNDTQEKQISFSSVNSELIVDKLRKTNISELSDLECREFVEDLIKLL